MGLAPSAPNGLPAAVLSGEVNGRRDPIVSTTGGAGLYRAQDKGVFAKGDHSRVQAMTRIVR